MDEIVSRIKHRIDQIKNALTDVPVFIPETEPAIATPTLMDEAARALVVTAIGTAGSMLLIWAIKRYIIPDMERMLHESEADPKAHAHGEQISPYEALFLRTVVRPGQLDCITYESVGGLQSQLEDIKRAVILPLSRPSLFSGSRLARRPTGVLLHGPPGTGKTLLAKVIARHARAHFFNVSIGSIYNKWAGESEKLVEALFSAARRVKRAIIFIDECDNLFGHRSGRSEGAHGSYATSVTNAFLACWDGLTDGAGKKGETADASDGSWVLVIGATNRPSDLDPAVLRRFSRHVPVLMPSTADREAIFKVHLAHEVADPAVDLQVLAGATAGLSGSDIREVVRCAALGKITEALDRHQDAEGTDDDGEGGEEPESPDGGSGSARGQSRSGANSRPQPIDTACLLAAVQELRASRRASRRPGLSHTGPGEAVAGYAEAGGSTSHVGGHGSGVGHSHVHCSSVMLHVRGCVACKNSLMLASMTSLMGMVATGTGSTFSSVLGGTEDPPAHSADVRGRPR